MSGTIEARGNIQSLTNFSNTASTYCYWAMFHSCERLVDISNLKFPATTFGEQPYGRMFSGCINLSAGPTVLPATTLTMGTYAQMFWNCTSLLASPDIKATSISPRLCIYGMFCRCAALTSITVHFTSWEETNGQSNSLEWVKNVNANGTFYHPAGLTDLTKDDNKVPTNFTTQVIS